MNNTLAQKRSAFALAEIKNSIQERDKFGKLVSGLPAMILQNGFGQAIAFLLAKGTKDGHIQNTDKHIVAFDILVRWLKKQNILSSTDRARAVIDLSQLDQGRYLYAQDEAMKVLEWVKRYANAGLFSE